MNRLLDWLRLIDRQQAEYEEILKRHEAERSLIRDIHRQEQKEAFAAMTPPKAAEGKEDRLR